jgi:hypothetical protein
VILYEILTGKPVFARDLTLLSVMGEIAWKNTRPGIPDAMLPDMARLIRNWWRRKPWKRLPFDGILMRLEAMDFKIAPEVRQPWPIIRVQTIFTAPQYSHSSWVTRTPSRKTRKLDGRNKKTAYYSHCSG